MTSFITLPGYLGSPETHWQTLWEADDRRFVRFAPSSWEAPQLADWQAALARALSQAQPPAVLVAHSLACLLVPHAAGLKPRPAAAFIVAPPDPAGEGFPAAAASFANVPMEPLPFPALVVASRTDPYAPLARARAFAQAWGAGFVDVGDRGHINSESALGPWPEGRNLLCAFLAGAGLPTAAAPPAHTAP